MPGLPKTSGERNKVEGKTERKSKLVIIETIIETITLKESKAMSYLLITLHILLAR